MTHKQPSPRSERQPQAAEAPSPRAPGRAAPAWVVGAAVVLVEYLTLSYLVDARDLLGPAGLAETGQGVGSLVPLLFVFAAAVLLTGGRKVRSRLRQLAAYREPGLTTLVWGTAHLVSFVAVVALALSLAKGSFSESEGRVWLGMWTIAAMLCVATLPLALWNGRVLADALGSLRRELTIGAVVGVGTWGLGMLSQVLWKPSAWLTLELVYALLVGLMPDPVAVIEESLVGTSRFYVEVAPVCSGIEGVGLMLGFVAAYLYGRRRRMRWPRSLWLLPASALAAWSLNVLRVTALIAIGTWWSPEVALGGFHSKAGWVFFTFTALVAVWVMHHSSTFRARHAQPEADQAAGEAAVPTPTPAASDVAPLTTAYLAPLLAVLAVKLVTGLAVSGFDAFYPLTVVAALLVLFRHRQHYPRWERRPSWQAMVTGAAVGVVWIVGFRRSATESTLGDQLAHLSPGLALGWLALRCVGTVVTVPIVEELAFRGYLLRRFVSADFDLVPYRRFSWLGLLVSSLAFGVMHSQWLLGMGAGLAFGALAIRSNRLSDAVIAHATANLAIVVYVLSTGDWALLG